MFGVSLRIEISITDGHLSVAHPGGGLGGLEPPPKRVPEKKNGGEGKGEEEGRGGGGSHKMFVGSFFPGRAAG